MLTHLWEYPLIDKGVCGSISLEFVNTIKENVLHPDIFMLLVWKISLVLAQLQLRLQLLHSGML